MTSHSISRTLVLSFVAALAAWSAMADPALGQPANDNCVNAAPLAVGGSVIVDTTTATTDAQSTPICGTGSLNKAVWYRVTGNGNTLTASTCNAGGGFNDTKLQVWRGDCAALICVGGSDDATCAISSLRSVFSWCSQNNVDYLVAVGGFSTNAGLISLSIANGASCAPPANDTCAAATVVDSLPFSQTINTANATAGLPNPSLCNSSSATQLAKDVWWQFTPAANCLLTATVDTPSYDAVTAVYTGATCALLVQTECQDDPEPHSFTLAALAGVTYWFQIGQFGSGTGTGGSTVFGLDCLTVIPEGACCQTDGTCSIQTELDCAAAGSSYQGDETDCDPNSCPQPPANDTCDTAETLVLTTGGSDSASGNNEVGTDDETPDCDESVPNQGIWYEVNGTGNTITASTCNPGTDFDTVLLVFCGCEELTCVGGNDDGTGSPPECSLGGLNRKSLFSWCSELGQTYYIHVGGFAAAAGNIELTVTDDGAACDPPADCTPIVPIANDTCDTATEIITLPFSDFVDNSDATADGPPGDCNIGDAIEMQNDIWYSWTATDDCLATATSSFPDYDGMTAVYQGPDCNNLTELTALCMDEPEPNVIAFNASAGTTYWFQLGDWGTTPGGGATTFALNCLTDLPTGACCLVNGDCSELTSTACSAAAGVYQGDDSSCEAIACPQPGTGDTCETPSDLNSNSSTTAEDHGGWFTFTATGPSTSVELCGSDFDTIVQILAEDCLTILAENDDCTLSSVFGGGSDPNASCFNDSSQPDSCLCLETEPGTSYIIHVGQFDGFGEPPIDPPADNRIVVTLTDKEQCRSCNTCAADVNNDGVLNGEDIQDFADCMAAAAAGDGEPTAGCGCADMPTRDNTLDADDVAPFVEAILNDTGDCP